MREELGDLLLHVAMHAQIAHEQDHFDFEAVAKEVDEKLIRRHPHVFGTGDASNTDEVMHVWDQIKAGEKKQGPAGKGLFKHIPPSIPALLYAREVYKEMRKKDMPLDALPEPSIQEESSQAYTEEQAGKELFQIVMKCRDHKMDPESALRRYTSAIIDKTHPKNQAQESS